MTQTALQVLSTFIVTVGREGHSHAAIARAKNAFLDTIGCMYVGVDSSPGTAAVNAARLWGDGSSPVIGRGITLPPPWAALANGAAAHAFDFDDYTLQANDHASAVLVPAVLAAANRPGHVVSGNDVLDAYLIGLEVIFRLGEAVNMHHYNLGWHTTSTLDSLGATAAVCRLWRLTEAQTTSALSLTTSMGSGYTSQFGTDGKPLHAGLSAQAALTASGLAQAGATGYVGALDGKVSFRTLLVPGGETRFEEAFVKLGNPWGIEEFGLGAKVYPSCGYTHRCIDAALEVRETLGLSSGKEIARVEASMLDYCLAILPFHVPKDRTEALFSTAYCVALALETGANRVVDFQEGTVLRPDLQDLTARVSVLSRTPKRPEINADPEDPDDVRVYLYDGREASAKVPIWTGAPGRDLDDATFDQKFRDCLALAPIDCSEAEVSNRLLAIRQMDQLASVDDLLKVL